MATTAVIPTGYDGSRGIECAEERWTLWGETCSATRRRGVVLVVAYSKM
jgi:hypothetical protein